MSDPETRDLLMFRGDYKGVAFGFAPTMWQVVAVWPDHSTQLIAEDF